MKCSLLTKAILLTSLAISFVISHEASASLGRKVNPKTIPSGVCRLELLHKSTGDSFHCTGSIIGKHFIKSAAHCFEKAELKRVRCLGEKTKIQIKKVHIYPEFDLNFIKRDKYNRWQDHALIETTNILQTKPFKAITSDRLLSDLINENPTCLIAGFGLQENATWGTGHLSGSLYQAERILFENRILLSQGRYKFELLPGDSGGPLLCRYQDAWYDLGSASAHDWDHNSVYAPNIEVKDWLESFPIEKSANHKAPLPSIDQTNPLVEVGKTYFLKPYSEVTEVASETKLFNGDNRYTKITIETIDGDRAFGSIESYGTSNFFLCEDQFLCYAQIINGFVSLKDIAGESIFSQGRPYSPFSKLPN